MRRNFMKSFLRLLPVILLCQICLPAPSLAAQDWVHTGTNLGNQVIRLAAADFKPVGSDPQTTALKAVFDATLYSDLGNAGIFDLVSKSMAPQSMPGSPQEIVLSQWAAPPASASARTEPSQERTRGTNTHAASTAFARRACQSRRPCR